MGDNVTRHQLRLATQQRQSSETHQQSLLRTLANQAAVYGVTQGVKALAGNLAGFGAGAFFRDLIAPQSIADESQIPWLNPPQSPVPPIQQVSRETIPQRPTVPVPQSPIPPIRQKPFVPIVQLPGTGSVPQTGWGIPIGFSGSEGGLPIFGGRIDFGRVVDLFGGGTTKIEAQKESIQKVLTPLFREATGKRALRYDSPGVRRAYRDRPDLAALRGELLPLAIQGAGGKGAGQRLVNQFLTNVANRGLSASEAVTLWNRIGRR